MSIRAIVHTDGDYIVCECDSVFVPAGWNVYKRVPDHAYDVAAIKFQKINPVRSWFTSLDRAKEFIEEHKKREVQ